MKRGLVVFAWLASAVLHAAVAGALALQPSNPVKIELPKSVQLVKLAPPKPAPVVEPTPPPPPVKPPPPKPKPEPVVKPKPKLKPKPVAKPLPPPEPEPEPPAEVPVAKAAPPAPPVKAPPAPPSPAPGPVYKPVDVGVAYLNNPKPPYPSVARRRGWEGTVVLLLNLDKDGNPVSVDIADSSGHRILDKAALATVRRWRFQPATRDGEAVAASNVKVPIQFSLNEG